MKTTLTVNLNRIGLPIQYTLNHQLTGIRGVNIHYMNMMLEYNNNDIEQVAKDMGAELIVQFEEEGLI